MATEAPWDQGPLCILRPSKDHGSLEEEPASMAALEALGEVTVVAIAGNQRGGKSTLMNLLHGRSLSGFQMGHYLDPKTSGVWVWPRPHPWQEGVTVLLVDSEGLDSPHVPHHYNWLLSAITLLASDVFMYQSRGSIEQSQGERLDMILRVAAQLSKTGGERELPDNPAGTFLWLLRDHQLRMRRSPREELLEKLDPAALQTMRRCFSDSDCVLLPRPVQSDEDMQQLDRLGYNDLSSEFREEFVVLERRLFDLVSKPRQMLGRALNGSTLASCLRSFVAAIQGKEGFIEDICSLPSQRELLLQVAGERTVKAALNAYREAMASAGVGSSLQSSALLLEAHAKAQQVAETAFEAEATAVGLLSAECGSFRAICEVRIAEWEPDAPSPEWPQNAVVEEGAAALLSGEINSGRLHRCDVAAPVLCRRGGVLKAGLLHEIWEKHARSAATAAGQAAADVLEPLQQRMEVTCGALSASSAEPFGHVEDVWKELRKVHDAVLPNRSKDNVLDLRANVSPSGASLAFWGAAAGDRVTLSLAQRDAAAREHAVNKTVHEFRDELRTEAQSKFEDLETSMARDAAKQATAMTELEQRQAGAIQAVLAQSAAKTEEVRQAVADVEASSKAMTIEVQSELQEVRKGAAVAAEEMLAEAQCQLRGVEAQLLEQLGKQQDALREAEVRLKESGALVEHNLREESAGLAKEFREGARHMQESTDTSIEKLRAEVSELEKRRCAAHLEVQQLLNVLESQQEKCKADLQEGMESHHSNFKSLQTETQKRVREAEEHWQTLMATFQGSLNEQRLAHQTFQVEMRQQCRDEEIHRKSGFTEVHNQLQEFQKQQEVPVTALQTSLGEQRTALEALQTDLEQRLGDEEGHRKSCFVEVQQQLQQLEERQQQPISTLQSSLAEQRSALESLQEEMQKLQSEDGDDRSDMVEMQQKYEAYKSMVTRVSQELRSRLDDLELQNEKVHELDLDGLQKEMKSQQEQLDLATKLCRNAETAAERLVSAILIASGFLGCSNMLALARPAGLYTVAFPLLAAGVGYHCGQNGYSVQQAIDALPRTWQPRLRTCFLRVAEEVQQRGLRVAEEVQQRGLRVAEEVQERGLRPLTRASKEIGLDKHARCCLSAAQSAVTTGAGKLRKYVVAETENTAPSNVDSEAPSPKRARISGCGVDALQENLSLNN